MQYEAQLKISIYIENEIEGKKVPDLIGRRNISEQEYNDLQKEEKYKHLWLGWQCSWEC